MAEIGPYDDFWKGPEEEVIPRVMQAFGIDEQRARFILAIERGESDGDIFVTSVGASSKEA